MFCKTKLNFFKFNLNSLMFIIADWVVLFGGPKTGTLYQVMADTNDLFVKITKNTNTFLTLSQINVGYQVWNSQNACQKSNHGRTLSACFFSSSLIWVCTICLSPFGPKSQNIYVISFWYIDDRTNRNSRVKRRKEEIFIRFCL